MSLQIQKKLKLIISLALLLLVLLSWFATLKVGGMQRDQLLEARFEQLLSLREALVSHIVDYQRDTDLALRTIAHDQSVGAAMEQIDKAFSALPDVALSVENTQSLLDYYRESHFKNTPTLFPDADAVNHLSYYLPKSTQGLQLQYRYVLGEQSVHIKGYEQVERQWHAYLAPLVEMHGFYDLFLIDTRGYIVYSVKKEIDFGTNVLNGPYKNTGIAEAFIESQSDGEMILGHSPFKPYQPSLNSAASFASMAIKAGGEIMGSVVVQLSIDPLNAIMSFNGNVANVGLGDAGEAYVVGENLTMRNDSRFLKETKNALVAAAGTSIGVQRVDTQAVRSALSGGQGVDIHTGYRGYKVLSAYEPITLFDEPAVVVVELSEKTVVAGINAAIDKIMIYVALGVALFWVALLSFFNKLLLSPLQALNEKLERDVLEHAHQASTSRSLLREYQRLVDTSSVVVKADTDGKIIYVNDAVCKISGYSREELIGLDQSVLRHDNDQDDVYNDMWATIRENRVWKGIIENNAKAGESYYTSTTVMPITNSQGEVYEYLSVATDVTDIYVRREELRQQRMDDLTGLPNRQAFMQDLAQRRAARVAILNISQFSEVNDYYGYDVGDELLKQVAELLADRLDDRFAAFRLSGDEFALLADNSCTPVEFENVTRGILELLESTRFTIADYEIAIDVVMGGAQDSSKVYVNASMALRAAKASQKKYFFYNSDVDIQSRTAENRLWVSALKQAIADDRIALFVQPMVNRKTGVVDKYECLMRLIDKDGAAVSPFFFMDVAKHVRLYPQLSETIIKKSFECFRHRSESFSINLTVLDILNDDTVELLYKLTSDRGVADRVVFEIVESDGIDNFKQVTDFIIDMKARGCEIAIDDFGTGYSNFEFLMRLEPDYVKIDGSIVKNIAQDDNVYAVTKLINDFAERVGAKTIAEFVCDEMVAERVAEIGVDYYQGYHYGAPMPASTLDEVPVTVSA